MQETNKIPKDIIENFEKHYKENVIQPTICLNGHGNIISYVRSNNNCLLTKENYARRVYKKSKILSRYEMVYMEIPNNKEIRYDYVFYDEQCEKIIQTFVDCEHCYCDKQCEEITQIVTFINSF